MHFIIGGLTIFSGYIWHIVECGFGFQFVYLFGGSCLSVSDLKLSLEFCFHLTYTIHINARNRRSSFSGSCREFLVGEKKHKGKMKVV